MGMTDNIIRRYHTGATRDTAEGKPNYEGYLSPIAIRRFGEYMLKHQVQPDGSTRRGDNWQKGIPLDDYIDSGFRHFMDWWLAHRGWGDLDEIEDALCGVIFNAQGYLHTILAMKETIQPVEQPDISSS
jgi:hypothetical protein